MRKDGRRDDELRPISFERHFNDTPDGSVLVSYGRTRVLCTACVEDGVPHWLANQGRGWVTGEYGMLPGSTGSRKAREARHLLGGMLLHAIGDVVVTTLEIDADLGLFGHSATSVR